MTTHRAAKEGETPAQRIQRLAVEAECTGAELDALASYLRTDSLRRSALELGVHLSTLKARLDDAEARILRHLSQGHGKV